MPKTPGKALKPVRTAKVIAKLHLKGSSDDHETLANSSPARPELRHTPAPPTPPLIPVQLDLPQPKSPVSTPKNRMDRVATQTEPLGTPDGVTPGTAQPTAGTTVAAVPADQRGAAEADPTIKDLHAMIKDLAVKVDRNNRSNSRSRSASSRRSRPRQMSSLARGFTPSSPRRSSHRRQSTSRSRSTRRRSHSRRRPSRPRTGSRTRSTSRRPRSPSRQRLSPRRERNQPAARRDATQALETQYPSLGTPAGKPLPIRELTMEPYRNLPLDLRKKAKERRSRRDLTFPEHICGFLKMLANSMDPTSEVQAALLHATQVAQDAATLPWPAVREWTQACMAVIEDGRATWHDGDTFIPDRTRLSWIKGRQMEADRHYPCLEYNKGECDHRRTHAAKGTT